VATAYHRLGERCGIASPPVAVRSSAADEDGAAASFAGQYETILNVSGLAAVNSAIQHCLVSQASEQVINYRRRKGLREFDVPIAVLVQTLIVADVAVVAFSVNPVTGSCGEVVINASWGLGESVVSGSVTPDTYVVRRRDRAIVQRSPARKQRMTVPVADGTAEVEVPQGLRDKAALDDGQVGNVAELAVALELTTGAPVDIECAYREGELYLLQCRPITTLR
jgi:pyruvate,water dikinase